MLILFLQIIYWCTCRRLGLVLHETLQIEWCQVDLVNPDQHWRWTQCLGPTLCHTVFFKVKYINLVFTNYELVYLQVPGFSWWLQVFLCVLQETLQSRKLLRDFPWTWNKVPAWLLGGTHSQDLLLLPCYCKNLTLGSSPLIESSRILGMFMMYVV